MSLQVILSPREGGTYDVTDYLAGGRFALDRGLGGEGARCSLSLTNYAGSVSHADVLATWDGTPIYQGRVIRRKRHGAGRVTWIDPECADAVQRMRHTLVAQVYEEVTARDILLDLLARYMPDVTPLIGWFGAKLSMTCNYITLEEAINRVADATGADWFLAPDGTLRVFTDPFDLGEVPAYNPSNILGDSLTDEVATAEFSNRVWVLGSKQASEAFKTQTYTGASDVYPLAYEPNYTQVLVNGVQRAVKLKENVDAETEFAVDKKRRAIERRIPLEPTDIVEIRYRPTVEIVDYFEDPASVAYYGLYETVIRDRQITDKTAARQRGRAALRRSANQRPVYSWRTDGEWDVYPGQRVLLAWPDWGIDQYVRLTAVGIDFQWLGDRWRVVASLTGEGL